MRSLRKSLRKSSRRNSRNSKKVRGRVSKRRVKKSVKRRVKRRVSKRRVSKRRTSRRNLRGGSPEEEEAARIAAEEKKEAEAVNYRPGDTVYYKGSQGECLAIFEKLYGTGDFKCVINPDSKYKTEKGFPPEIRLKVNKENLRRATPDDIHGSSRLIDESLRKELESLTLGGVFLRAEQIGVSTDEIDDCADLGSSEEEKKALIDLIINHTPEA